jgi:hypothetical protein
MLFSHAKKRDASRSSGVQCLFFIQTCATAHNFIICAWRDEVTLDGQTMRLIDARHAHTL